MHTDPLCAAMAEPVFELLPQSGYEVDPDRLAWPETQALAATLSGYTFGFQMPECFCPSCVRKQPLPGYCGMCSMIREAFPLETLPFIATGLV